MFWVVFFFPGKPGYLLPLENPPSRTEVAGMPGCRRLAEPRGVREAPPAPSAPAGRGGAFVRGGR